MKYSYWEIEEATLWKTLATNGEMVIKFADGKKLYLTVHLESQLNKDEE